MQARSAPVSSDKYVRELDGIRAISIAIVVCAHYKLVPLIPGGFGVTLFFFLSGYLITTLFYSEFNKTGDISIYRFYLRRWLRLTPTLVIAVLMGVVFYRVTRVAVGGTPVPLGTTMAALFYYTNYYDLAWGLDDNKVIPFGIFWSLAVEEHFYLLWPLAIRTQIRNTKRLLVIIVSVCTAVLLWRLIAHSVLNFSTNYTYMATDCRIDSILFGSLLRVLFQTSFSTVTVAILKSSIVRIISLLALIATFVIRDDAFRETIRYSIQGLALMPLFSIVLLDQPTVMVRRVLSLPIIVWIGRLSYSIYIFHLMARTPAETIFSSPYGVGSTVFGLVATGALAYAMYVFVEKPISRIRHELRGKERVTPSLTTMDTKTVT